MERITPLLDPEAPNVLVAHCFAAGGAAGGSERSFIGGAEEVPVSSFEAFDYAALGHLHRRQAAGPRARYPGTPLAYSFDEAAASPAKGFLLVELSKGSFSEELVALEPLHRLTRVEGSYDELSLPGAFAAAREDYVEARLTDLDPVLDPVDALRANFPNLLSVRQAAFELAESLPGRGGGAAAAPAQGAACRGPEAVMADFRSFYGEVRRAAPDAETEGLFAELVKEAEHETP
jgi:exonuclease SbcD